MVKLSRDVCPKCYQQEEDLFAKVKDYVRANPNASIPEIGLALNISEDQISFFVNSGRLERTGVNVPHQCRACNKVISTGLICPDCSNELKVQVTDLKKTITEKKENEGKGESLFKKKDP